MSDQSEGVAASLQAILDGMSGFAETPTSLHIRMALERTYATGTITAIAGVPGVGKTTTCRLFERENSHVWRCQFTRYSRSSYAILTQIAQGIGSFSKSGRTSELGTDIQHALSGVVS